MENGELGTVFTVVLRHDLLHGTQNISSPRLNEFVLPQAENVNSFHIIAFEIVFYLSSFDQLLLSLNARVSI
jgi:hypothetical protein